MKLRHLLIIFLAVTTGLWNCKTELPYDSTFPSFSKDKPLTANVDEFVNHYVSESGPGMTLLVYARGQMLVKKGYGLANIDEKTPMSAKTPVYLASVSKQITAMAIMILAADKVLDLHDHLNRFLPETPDTWKPITLHHLLTHQSGVPNYFDLIPEPDMEGLTNRDVLDLLLGHSELNFKPGEQFEYSNSGYVLLAIVVERVTGVEFHTFVRNRIFDVLEMNSSFVYDESKPEIPNRAVGCYRNGTFCDYNLLTMGPGGMYSSAEDLFKWDRSFYHDTLVSPSIGAAAFTDHEERGYGYGWQIKNYRGREMFFHGGSLRGYITRITRIPEEDTVIVILSNGSFGPIIYELNSEILYYLFE